jgi:hypothetical protein
LPSKRKPTLLEWWKRPIRQRGHFRFNALELDWQLQSEHFNTCIRNDNKNSSTSFNWIWCKC